jgi:hypothetical protein
LLTLTNCIKINYSKQANFALKFVLNSLSSVGYPDASIIMSRLGISLEDLAHTEIQRKHFQQLVLQIFKQIGKLVYGKRMKEPYSYLNALLYPKLFKIQKIKDVKDPKSILEVLRCCSFYQFLRVKELFRSQNKNLK